MADELPYYPLSPAQLAAINARSIAAGAGGYPTSPGPVPAGGNDDSTSLGQVAAGEGGYPTSPARGGLSAVPAPAAAPVGGLGALNIDLGQYQRQLEIESQRRNAVRQAELGMIDQRMGQLGKGGISDLDRASMLFQAAGAFAAPTRTGNFMENLGAAGTALSGPLAKAAEAQRDREDKMMQLQLARSKLAAEMGTGGVSSDDMLKLFQMQRQMTPQPSEFERLVSGLSPEERQKALRVKAGLEKPEGKSDKLPFNTIKEFSEVGGVLKTFDQLGSNFKNDFADKSFSAIGDFQNWLGSRNALGYGDQADWWSDYYRQRNVARNALFGSALTKTEASAFEKTDINPGMAPEQIKKNLERQREVSRSAAYKLGASMARQGYDQDTIEEAIGYRLKELMERKKIQDDKPESKTGSDPLSAARDAIKRGAPRDAVIQRLKDNGIDTSGL